MSADNVFGFLVLVGVPAFLIAVRMITKRFLDPDPRETATTSGSAPVADRDSAGLSRSRRARHAAVVEHDPTRRQVLLEVGDRRRTGDQQDAR